jgi:transmembrane sensor
MNEQELQQFLVKLASGAYTNEEYKVFVDWVENCSREEYELMLIYWEQAIETNADYAIDQNLIAKIEQGLDRIDKKENTPVIPLYREPAKHRRLWPHIAAAASILLVISAGSYFLLRKARPQQQMAQNHQPEIKPGGNKAILTLSNGIHISLTDAKKGNIAVQANTVIKKTADGKIAYEAQNGPAPTEVQYNTVTTPRGGRYEGTLSDGTRFILDAASSIRFPVKFTAGERLVTITGQVWIKVKFDAAHPFRVSAKGQMLEDLGTEFNINAYDDEPYIRTTLIEGSVKVSKQQQSVVLVPGQQAVNDSQAIKVQKVNVDDIIAWKNGQTNFNDENIQEIMRAVSRWYGVDVRYEGQIPTRQFDGSISRNANFADLLKILTFNNIHYKINGNQITILP